jgi:hypothetical protein
MRIAHGGAIEVLVMPPLTTVVGCLLLIVGLWGSMASLHRDGSR